MSRLLVAALIAASLAGVTLPASAQSSYGSRDALRTQDVFYGKVLQSSPEAIKQESNGAYTAAGAAVGAALGSQVQKQGSGQWIGGIIGGVLGGAGADLLQRRDMDGQNVLVRLDDTRTLFVLMPLVNGRMFAPGQRVAVASVNGQNRIIDTPAAPAPDPQAQRTHELDQAQRDAALRLQALGNLSR